MSRAEIIAELDALGAHYTRPVRSPEEHARFLQDYLDDLHGFPIEAIRLAVRSWRQSEATRFPKSGEFLVHVRRHADKSDGEKPKAWSDLTNEEYEALPLRAKARHHRILAHQARRKAGPMWTNTGKLGRALKLEDMPQHWHSWRARADNHDKEANRLEELVRQARERGEDAA